MYLFTRQTRLAPAHMRDGMAWAVEITEKVNKIVSIDVGLWTSTLSTGLGTLSWGATVESLGDLEDADAKLQVDPIIADLTQRGAELTLGGLDDQVAQYLVGGTALDFEPNVVGVVQSRVANGKFQAGIAAGMEIAEQATRIGGLPTAFLLASTGEYGGCAWMTAAPSLRDLERGEQTVNGDASFIALVDEKSTCYVEGITTQSIWRRIV